VNNRTNISHVLAEFEASVAELTNPAYDNDPTGRIAAVQGKFYSAFNFGFKPILNLGLTQLGLGQLPANMKKALAFIPSKVDAFIVKVKAVDKVAARLSALQGNMFRGILGNKVEFDYAGGRYALWVAVEGLINKTATVRWRRRSWKRGSS